MVALGYTLSFFFEHIMNVVRILCGSYTIAGRRVADPDGSDRYCMKYGAEHRNSIKHALLYCKDMEIQRNILWEWFTDKLPVEVSSMLYSLDDDQFLFFLFGDISPVMDTYRLTNFKDRLT